jgi:spermidine synthase
VAVTEQRDESGSEPPARSIIVNGKSDSSTRWDTHTLKLSAHLPALFCRNEAKSAMVVGLGTGVTVGELGLHPGIERLEVAEISPTVIEALPLFGDYTHQVHQDPRLTLHQGDAFRVIGRSQGKWDIIISEPSNPWVTGVDMLFSDRFYKEVQPHLSEGGVFLQWVQIYNTSPEVLGMVMRTISEHFRYVRVFAANGGDLLLLAAQHDLDSTDILRAEKRWQDNEAVRLSLETIGIRSLDGLLLREIFSPDHLRAAFTTSPLQTLDHPRLHYLAGRHLFFGSSIELSTLLSMDTAANWPAYALAKRHPDWATRCLDEALVAEAIRALTDASTTVPMDSIATAVVLKAMTTAGCPAGEDFGGKTNESTKALVRLIGGQGMGEDDWQLAGLGEAELRERVSSLVGVVQRTRNWIVPYPLDGLLQLLEQGAKESAADEERSWYLQQRAHLNL